MEPRDQLLPALHAEMDAAGAARMLPDEAAFYAALMELLGQGPAFALLKTRDRWSGVLPARGASTHTTSVSPPKAAGVPTAIYYPIPLSQQTAYRHWPAAPGGVPCSERLAREVLSLPMHPYLDPATQDRIVAAVLGGAAASLAGRASRQPCLSDPADRPTGPARGGARI